MTDDEVAEQMNDEIAQLMEPGRWWRVIGPDGELWCETSDGGEARQAVRPGDRIERLYEVRLSEWRVEEIPD